MEDNRYLTFIVECFSFISAFAAVAASLLIFRVTKKFGTGILATGFKNIASGVLFIAFGMIIDAFTSYILLSIDNIYILLLMLVKVICFIVGTYIIVVGSKKTADKLETITR